MSSNEKFPDGQLPPNQYILVIEYTTIYKTDKWWKVVALINQKGYNKVVTLMYMMEEGKDKWKQVQKASTTRLDEWNKVDAATRKYLESC